MPVMLHIQLGCGRPEMVGGWLVQVQHFAARVGDGIVRPGCQLVLAAVLGPGVAGASLGDDAAEAFVGDDIDPWCGCSLPG